MWFAIILLILSTVQMCKAETIDDIIQKYTLDPAEEGLRQKAVSKSIPKEPIINLDTNYLSLSTQTADSMKNFLPKNIKNIGIWRIDGNRWVDLNTEALRDSLEVAIVKGHRFNLIDRTKLNVIFEEQGLSQTGLIDPAKMKKIGKLYGIDAIIFVEILQNIIDEFDNATIIVKAIDTDTGLLSYTAEFPISGKYMRTEIDDLCGKFINSINSDKKAIKEGGIDTIAFWQIEGGESGVDTSALISKLSNCLVNSKMFKVIDRGNLAELLNEQAFGATGLVDAATAKRLGKLYGVDAFIFGRSRSWEKSEKVNILSSNIKMTLKMIDVDTAKIVWADELEGDFNKPKSGIYSFFGARPNRDELVDGLKSAIIPGWSQFDKGQGIKARTLLAGVGFSIAGYVVANQKYNEAWNSYQNAASAGDINNYYNRADLYNKARDGLKYFAIGIYLYNVWDAIYSEPDIAQKAARLYWNPYDRMTFGVWMNY